MAENPFTAFIPFFLRLANLIDTRSSEMGDKLYKKYRKLTYDRTWLRLLQAEIKQSKDWIGVHLNQNTPAPLPFETPFNTPQSIEIALYFSFGFWLWRSRDILREKRLSALDRNIVDTCTRVITAYLRRQFKTNTVGILHNYRTFSPKTKTSKRQDAVCELVFNKIPIPAPNTPWSVVIEHRQNQDIKMAHYELKNGSPRFPKVIKRKLRSKRK
jgi:hypothetical protein